MSFYRITIWTRSGRKMSGIREDSLSDIELFWKKAEQKAIRSLKGDYEKIDVVMLSKNAPEVRDWIRKQHVKDGDDRVVYSQKEGNRAGHQERHG
jgi:hypothetical protein